MNNTVKYIIKDSCNTYIKMVDSLDDVYKVLDKKKEFFKNNYYSTFGSSLDGSKTYEDNAVFDIPEDMQMLYKNNKYIKFYFFKFDLLTNKMIELY